MNGMGLGRPFDDMMLFNWLLENINCGANVGAVVSATTTSTTMFFRSVSIILFSILHSKHSVYLMYRKWHFSIINILMDSCSIKFMKMKIKNITVNERRCGFDGATICNGAAQRLTR